MKATRLFSFLIICLVSVFIYGTESFSVQYPIRSDVIVTKWPESSAVEDHQPGWMRRQLIKFGEVASKLGNAMGSHATKITTAIDKICEVIKTIIPFIAAVCHVGQFKFCGAATAAPGELNEAMNPANLNLDVQDRR